MIRTYQGHRVHAGTERPQDRQHLHRAGWQGDGARAGEVSTTRQIEDLLESKRKWIYRNLAEWQDLNARRVHRDYVNGEGFLYLGRSYRLKLVPELAEPLMLKDGYFCLRADQRLHRRMPTLPSRRSTGKRDRRAFRHGSPISRPKMDVQPKSVKVMDLKHRWASCTPGGNLNFHWKCMMAPLTILDYIVVHELAHLIYPNHTAAFWNEVDKVMPTSRNGRNGCGSTGRGWICE